MPNWVRNVMTFDDNVTKEKVIKLIMNENGDVDFNILVPMPKELDIERSSKSNKALSMYLNKHPEIDPTPFNLQNVTMNHQFEETPEMLELGKRMVDNYYKYGYVDWYDWSCNNWGCKWNASETFYDGNILEFVTPWTTPYEFFSALAKALPDVQSLIVDYADEDIGMNAGFLEISNGEVIKNAYDYSEESVKHANMIWGW